MQTYGWKDTIFHIWYCTISTESSVHLVRYILFWVKYSTYEYLFYWWENLYSYLQEVKQMSETSDNKSSNTESTT